MDKYSRRVLCFPLRGLPQPLLRCASGATVSLDIDWAANREPVRELVVRGNEGGTTLDIRGMELWRSPEPDGDPISVSTETNDWLAPEGVVYSDTVSRDEPPVVGRSIRPSLSNR